MVRRVAVHAAEEALQLHGGIGMTWEHPLHLYLKRAKATEIALGTPGDHREALASLADVPGPVTHAGTMTPAPPSSPSRQRRSRGGAAVRSSEVSSRSAKCAHLGAGERAIRAVPGAQVVDRAEEEVDDEVGRDVGR